MMKKELDMLETFAARKNSVMDARVARTEVMAAGRRDNIQSERDEVSATKTLPEKIKYMQERLYALTSARERVKDGVEYGKMGGLHILESGKNLTDAQVLSQVNSEFYKAAVPRINALMEMTGGFSWENIKDAMPYQSRPEDRGPLSDERESYQQVGRALELAGHHPDTNKDGYFSRREILADMSPHP